MQKFAIENTIPLIGENNIDQEIRILANIEEKRIQASNDLKNAEEKLKTLEKADNDPFSLMYIGSTIKELSERETFQSLKTIDARITRLRAFYKEDDKAIVNLKKERAYL